MTRISERERDATRKRQSRKADRDLIIPAVANRRRRNKARRDVYHFLATYFPQKFCDPFTPDRREMVQAVLDAATYGTDQAIAAPRGEGKTTIAEAVTIYCLNYGLVKFPLVIGATGTDADRILANIKFEYECNDLLADDFPEICVPVRALEGAPQRAGMQTVKGQRTLIRWSGSLIVFPTVKGSLASGSVLGTRGLDGALRGIRHRNLRPDLILIDDAETRESAQSDTQTRSREVMIDQDVAGLGGPGKRVAKVMLCTVMNRRCVSYKFTDPQQKPAWNGKRYALLKARPTHEELWDEYVFRRLAGMSSGEDRFGRGAQAFYVANREAMDAGAEVSNPNRFIRQPLADGSPTELSALQHCFNLISDRGRGNFDTEYQNDPPIDDEPTGSGITAQLVQSRVNGLRQNVAPRDLAALVAFIDLGKYACHYTVTAWRSNATGFVIDYGVENVNNANIVGPEKAILAALHSWRDARLRDPYVTEDGEPRRLDAVLIDAGNWDETVYTFLRDVGGNPFRASKGFGQSHEQSPFKRLPQGNSDKIVGEHWIVSRQGNGVWLHELDADYWKRWCHDRLMTPVDKPGSLSLFGTEARVHTSFAHHIVAEVEKEEFVPGRGLRRFWEKVSRNNHWLDSTWGCCVAASMSGIALMPAAPAKKSNEESKAESPLKFRGKW